MSSELEGVGVIAAAVVAAPVAVAAAAAVTAAAAAVGTGWLVLETGKAMLAANEAVDRRIQEQKRQEAAAEKQRRAAALAGYRELEALCRGLMAELDAGDAGTEDVKRELEALCREDLSGSAADIQRRCAAGMARLEDILSRQRRLKDVRITGSGAYDGLAAAELLSSLRLAFRAAELSAGGADVRAADPQALERADLNRRLAETAGRVEEALEFIVEMEQNYGLSQANQAWFQSCFYEVDRRIDCLCDPCASNRALKEGLRELEQALEQFEALRPNLEREARQISAAYPAYADAARALGEQVRSMRSFQSAAALKSEVERLDRRMKRAETCAAIYQKLGRAAYLCYAWDEELRALGYSVQARKNIREMARRQPERASLHGQEMPFYQWGRDAMTQIYHIDAQCDLQLVVNPDGTAVMQAISSDGDAGRAAAVQKAHCAKMRTLYQRLRENWFILYDPEEIAAAEQVLTVEDWRTLDGNAWTGQGADAGVRETGREEKQLARQQRGERA